jgi:galactokinase
LNARVAGPAVSAVEATSRDGLDRLVDQARQTYQERFGSDPAWFLAAPGRVNLIGEHVDYNGGFVLPMAIERHVVIAAGGAPDQTATFYSTARNEQVVHTLADEIKPGPPSWANYVLGVLAGFKGCVEFRSGFRAVIHADLPVGGGLSSSAALEVACCLLCETVTGHSMSERARIFLCQRAEHVYAGVPCGIMDQFIVTRAQEGHALLLDCRSLEAWPVSLSDPEVAILVVHSGVVHELARGEYAVRRQQCVQAARKMGLSSLRDADLARLQNSRDLMDPAEYSRARHVITEIQRTQEFAQALEQRSWKRAGELMYASHDSLRDDYQVSCPELDALVELSRDIGIDGGLFGSRLTGGGFGGCTVSLVHSEAVEHIQRTLSDRYQRRIGIAPWSFATRAAGAARTVARKAGAK